MKTLTALLIALALIGCETTVESSLSEEMYYGHPIETVTYDSCEYVRFYNGTATWGAHKGNCKFCKQRTTTNTGTR